MVVESSVQKNRGGAHERDSNVKETKEISAFADGGRKAHRVPDQVHESFHNGSLVQGTEHLHAKKKKRRQTCYRLLRWDIEGLME